MNRKLVVEGLTKRYRGRTVIEDISLHIQSGEVVGLLGPNGAGKTTTFYCVVGLTQPEEGRVLLGGQDVTRLPMYLRARSGISYLPQEPSIFRKMTVEENLIAILETLDMPPEEIRQRTAEVLDELKITHLARSRAYNLSGGERRRAEIARALVISPSFILLDEPFSGIDPIAVADIQKIIYQLKRKGIGLLMTDHNVQETLRITDRAYIIAEGRIFRRGSPDQLAADPKVREIYLGADFRLLRHDPAEIASGTYPPD
ncbi:MAG TPA: LPS export ABC transporter ATP-binding protein [Candidatus Saccharimonadales bacterium]|nr:LPS export ABC transporter ATP-binding protein [Candidatus Saccharimonadales bacterium]